MTGRSGYQNKFPINDFPILTERKRHGCKNIKQATKSTVHKRGSDLNSSGDHLSPGWSPCKVDLPYNSINIFYHHHAVSAKWNAGYGPKMGAFTRKRRKKRKGERLPAPTTCVFPLD